MGRKKCGGDVPKESLGHWLKKRYRIGGGEIFRSASSPLFISLPRHCCLPSFPHPPPPFSLVFVASAASAAASLALARKGGKEEKFVPLPLSPFVSSPPPPFLFLSRGKRERRRKLFLQVPSPTHLVPRRGFAAVEALTFIGFDWERRRRRRRKTRRIIIPLLRPVRGLS